MAVKTNALWNPGEKIRVRFLGGSHSLHSEVKKYAREWGKYANIHFKFRDHEPSDIRIAFLPGVGSWSQLGTEARRLPSPKPTMNLGINSSSSTRMIQRTILHEFGHALGCIHEHSSPASTIKWDKKAVILQHRGLWSPAKVRHNIFKKFTSTQTQFSKFDSRSIMLYPIPSSWTKDGWSSKWNTVLSATDKAFIGKLYPKSVPGPPPRPQPPPNPNPNCNVTGNLCGDPCCGATFICAADYNRRVRPSGFPGVPGP